MNELLKKEVQIPASVVRVYDSDGKLLHIRDFTSTSEAENTEYPQESSMSS